jgi:hypothetical protein
VDPCQDGQVSSGEGGGGEGCVDPCQDGQVSSGEGGGGEGCVDPCQDGQVSSGEGGGGERDCTYSADASKTLTQDICYSGENIHVSVTGTGSATSKESQSDAQDKADAAALADAQDKLAAALEGYSGFVDGTCTYSADASKTLSKDICYSGENIHVSVTGTGSATSKESQETAQDLADSFAALDAEQKLTAALAQYPGYVEGTCAVPVPYTAQASTARVMDICYAGASKTVTVLGSGSGTSSDSAADAQQQADAAATADVNAKLATALGGYPGYTEGACAPTVVTVVEPGTVVTEPPTVVTVPEEGTVPETAPETTTLPQEATIPTSVPAGGGSSAPRSPTPLWAFALLLAGALGAAGVAGRVATSRRK